MFGKLTWDAVPWDQPIPLATGAAVILVVLAVLAWVVIKGHLPYLWREWITTVDHKRIGVMYILLGLLMLLRGFIDGIMMRSQQALAYNAAGYLPPEHSLAGFHGGSTDTGFISNERPLRSQGSSPTFTIQEALSLEATRPAGSSWHQGEHTRVDRRFTAKPDLTYRSTIAVMLFVLNACPGITLRPSPQLTFATSSAVNRLSPQKRRGSSSRIGETVTKSKFRAVKSGGKKVEKFARTVAMGLGKPTGRTPCSGLRKFCGPGFEQS